MLDPAVHPEFGAGRTSSRSWTGDGWVMGDEVERQVSANDAVLVQTSQP
jgi:hypothetical protein